MLTKGFMASDVLDRAEIDLILMPRANVRPPTGCPTLSYGASVSKVTYKAWRTTPCSSARFCRALRPNVPRPLERPPESSMT